MKLDEEIRKITNRFHKMHINQLFYKLIKLTQLYPRKFNQNETGILDVLKIYSCKNKFKM